MKRSVLFLLVTAGLILAFGGALWFTSSSTEVQPPAAARTLKGPSFAVPDKAVRPEVKAMRQALDDELGAKQGKRGKGKRKARAAASDPDAPRPVPTATARQAAAGLGPTLSSRREPPKAMSAGQQVTRSPRGGGGKGKRGKRRNAAP